MKLLAVTPLGRNRDKSRLWIETRRLEALGFPPGTPFTVEARSDKLVLRPSILADNHVSSRRTSTGLRPIIDVANQAYLGPLAEFPELKVTGWLERLQISPTRRATAILRSRRLEPPFRVLEVFAGGGTMTAALTGNDHFVVQAGIEIEPRFAEVWQAAHPEAALIQGDIRALEVSDLPPFDILIGEIPCTSQSILGRAKKRLAGKPEMGASILIPLPFARSSPPSCQDSVGSSDLNLSRSRALPAHSGSLPVARVAPHGCIRVPIHELNSHSMFASSAPTGATTNFSRSSAIRARLCHG